MLTRPARIALLVAASTTAAADDPSSIDLGPFAVDVVRGKANITILGDSISNFSQSDWMYTGLLLEWRPHRWRQIHTSPLASGPAIGSWANLTASADYTIVHPGQVRPGLELMVGACPWSVQVIRGDGWSGRGISAGFHRMAFQYEGGLMRDADGTARFLRSGRLERHRVLIVADATAETRATWNVRSRNSAAGTATQSSHPNITFTESDSPALSWFDDLIPGSTEAAGHVASEVVIDVDEPLIEGEWCGLAGTILTEVESRTGLGLSFIGQNAWRTENHRHPSGDPAVPEIYQPAPYRGSYSNEALRRHVLAHESSHFMLMIGTNNGGEDHDAPERTVADVAAILDRIRTVHAMARLSAPELEPPRFLLIAPYATTDANTFFPGYAEGLRTIASSAEDVGFIDLHRLVLERFGIWLAWQADLLVDGTHPSLRGSTTFASMLWRELSAAAGSPADLDRNGIVDGADFGLLLASWGCEDPGYADLDGDECVDGADVGLLLADWFGG